MTRRGLLIAPISVSATGFGQKGTAPGPQDKFVQANNNVRELLLLMDADKNGRISKKEWMSFMEAEFNRLDKDGSGELDINELRQSGVTIRRSKS
jgi:Ca2+-binding EF-hand superfamily protein